jgi:hypothetical protein
MDRLFLDANVLFSAAYRANTGLLQFWKLRNVVLCSSRYAIEEARINLNEGAQRSRLVRLVQGFELYDASQNELPRGIVLPEKDRPILLAARATHLLTGDLRHFGPYIGKTIAGILVLTPSGYLKKRRPR